MSRIYIQREMEPGMRKALALQFLKKYCQSYYIYLFIILLIFYREEGREIELETSMREKHRSAASCTPPTGMCPQLRHMPLTGIEPGTFQSAGQCSVH